MDTERRQSIKHRVLDGLWSCNAAGLPGPFHAERIRRGRRRLFQAAGEIRQVLRTRQRVVHKGAAEQLTLGIGSLRRLITDLRPPILDEAGVQPALEHLVERLGMIADLDVRMNVDLAYESGRRSYRLSPAVEDALFRVVQEALHNVVKHAQAKTVDVSIVEADGRVDIRIADDGVGIGEHRETSGFGLQGMQERIELAGGSLEITCPAAGGTEIRAFVPVSPAPAGSRPEKSRG